MTIINPVVFAGGGGPTPPPPFWWAETYDPLIPFGQGVHFHLQTPPGITELEGGPLWAGIGYGAKLTIHSSDLTTIKSGAIPSWSSAKELVIEPGITTLESSSIPGWGSATKLVLPETLEYLGAQAFPGWASLTDLTLPSHLEFVGGYAFGGTKLPEVNLSAGTIGDFVFNLCTLLTQATIVATETVGSSVFNACSSLEEVSLEAGISIGNEPLGAGLDVIHTARLTAPSIGEDVAGYVSPLQKLIFGEGTISIGNGIVSRGNNRAPQVIDFPSTIQNIGSCNLWATDVTTVHVIYRGAPVIGEGDKFGASFSFPDSGDPGLNNEVRLYVPDEHLSAFLSDPDLGGWASFGSGNIYALSTFVDPTE